MGSSLNKDYVKSKFMEAGITPLEEYESAKKPMICLNKDGYYIRLCWSNFINGKTGNTHSPKNPYTIKNINLFLERYGYNDFECISDMKEYKSNQSLLRFIHKKCGCVILRKQSDVTNRICNDKIKTNRRAIFCEKCDIKSLESTHASVLKQVWLHEREGTITEDRSCINPLTNCCLPTDIVNHVDKIAIEVQSWFHDFEDSKIRDKIKKEYWINRGYKFYAVDQRDYTILEMVQLFFPNIKEIPDYIDINFGKKLNDLEVQKLLNQGYKVPEIAKKLNEPTHKIRDAIRYGRIEYPKDYIRADKKSVVQLDFKGNYIGEYNSLKEAEIHNKNIKASLISSCLNSHRNISGGYIWIEKEKYYSGNYILPQPKGSRLYIPIDKYDLNNNFIEHYESIYEAINKHNEEIKGTENKKYESAKIFKAVSKNNGFYKGFIWRKSN